MSTVTPIVLSWSGGKDSAWALHVLRGDPRWEVRALLTTVTAEYERVSIHGLRRELLLAQADAAGLPVFEARIPPRADNATYEQALGAAFAGVRHIAFGDLFLADVRAYREALCARQGWTPVFPLFGADSAALARAMIDGGLRARLCCVDTAQLEAHYAGREFDATLLADLPSGVDPCGERGEFHTVATAGPMFDRALRVRAGDRILREARFLYLDLTLA